MDRLRFSGLEDLKQLSRLSTPVWIFDVDHHYIWWANDQGLAFWKAESNEELRKRDFSTDSSTVRERLSQIFESASSESHVTDTWTLYPGGIPQTTILSFQPIEMEDQFKGVMIELVQLLKRNADDETWRLLEAARATSLLMTTFSMDGRLLVQNPAALDCYGGAGNTEQSQTLADRFLDKKLSENVLQKARSDETTNWETDVITAKGVRTHLISARKGRDPINGDFVVVLSEEDVTEQAKLRRLQQSEKEALQHEVAESSDQLRISRQRFELAVRTAAIWDWDGISDDMFLSPNLLKNLGYTPEEFSQKSSNMILERLVHPKDLKAYKHEIGRHFASPDYPLEHEVRILTKSGKALWFHSHGNCVRDENGRVTRSVGLLTDITKRKELEASLLVSQRMEAIGRLTGGIAHDFNNLLTVIQGNAQLLEELGVTDKELTGEIISAVKRGSDLTTHLLAFAKQQTLLPKSVDLNQLISLMKKTLLRTLSENIDVEYTHDPNLWNVFADPTQIEAAILNLAFNARDAMPHGGTLRISCSNRKTTEINNYEILELSADEYVEISVTDTGCGMSEDLVQKAFEPFFTTKKFGKGSGLGLSMVLGFSRQSHGDARIVSDPSQGTTVSLFLPRNVGATDAVSPERTAKVSLGNKEKVHILEDNLQVQETVAKLVEALGYTVTTSSDVESAITVANDNPDTDIFLVDIILPGGKSGVDFANYLHETHPNTKVILMSGYPESELTETNALTFEFISKPFDKAIISKAIKSALNNDKA